MRVAIAGAGPAGASAAIVLARAGVAVSLFDRATWPRAKTCGDGLTPSSIARYRELGLDLRLEPSIATTAIVGGGRALAHGRWPRGLPNGTCCERIESDDVLVEAAAAAGATFSPKTTVLGFERGRVSVEHNGTSRSEDADVLLVADGATGVLARKFGFPPHRSRLVALRGYCDAIAEMPPEYMVHYDAKLAPGYAWIFPIAPRRANVGVAVTQDVATRDGGDPRALLRAWLRRDARARAYVDPDVELDDVHGGIIPTGRAERVRGPVWLLGDAAGVADPLSAEGISQAMDTGITAARTLLAASGDIVRAGETFAASFVPYDRNEREARRMMRWMRIAAEPIVALAAVRPPVADALIASGYFLKTDSSWFTDSMRSLIARR